MYFMCTYVCMYVCMYTKVSILTITLYHILNKKWPHKKYLEIENYFVLFFCFFFFVNTHFSILIVIKYCYFEQMLIPFNLRTHK